MTKAIQLTQGKVTIVDDEDFEELNSVKWYALRSPRKFPPDVFYAVRSDKDGSQIRMHRVILGCIADVDHIDGDGLNNQRSNLRPTTDQLNAANRRHVIHGTSSKFRGVTWNKKRGRWQAQIQKDARTIYLGLFDEEAQAAIAFDREALHLFGQHARLNFPHESAT